jgi:hypothetical protein
MTLLLRPVVFMLMVLSGATVHAWSRPGHMVTGEIAYEDLLAKDSRVIDQVVDVIAKHPERAPFEVATGAASGAERSRRIFMEMGRWADDVRSGSADHPSWHYSGRPLIDASSPPSPRPVDVRSGAALEAFALQWKIASDKRGVPAERAVALCWVFHLIGDIHQPLHAADEYSSRLPEGDRGGNLLFVREPDAQQPTNLHAFWDGIVHGTGDSAEATAQARRLIRQYPRAQFKQLTAGSLRPEFGQWADESVDLAKRIAYRNDLVRTTEADSAKVLTAAYIRDATATGEQQITLAGYRLADALRALFKATP